MPVLSSFLSSGLVPDEGSADLPTTIFSHSRNRILNSNEIITNDNHQHTNDHYHHPNDHHHPHHKNLSSFIWPFSSAENNSEEHEPGDGPKDKVETFHGAGKIGKESTGDDESENRENFSPSDNNMFHKPLKVCNTSHHPGSEAGEGNTTASVDAVKNGGTKTGFDRDGFCRSRDNDDCQHTVCIKPDFELLRTMRMVYRKDEHSIVDPQEGNKGKSTEHGGEAATANADLAAKEKKRKEEEEGGGSSSGSSGSSGGGSSNAEEEKENKSKPANNFSFDGLGGLRDEWQCACTANLSDGLEYGNGRVLIDKSATSDAQGWAVENLEKKFGDARVKFASNDLRDEANPGCGVRAEKDEQGYFEAYFHS